MSGSCMTNIGHFHAAGKVLKDKSDAVANRALRLRIAPPTKSWARGYFVSIVGVDEAMVRAYIRNQDDEDEGYDQMK